AAHDLDKVVAGFSCFHLVEKGSGIGKTGGDCHLDIQARHIVGGFLDTFCSSHIGELQFCQLLAGEGLHRCPQGRLHNTACGSEDAAGSRGLAMGSSNFSSGREVNSMPHRRISRASSLVVMAISTSGTPAALWSSLPISNFLAVQGITLTDTIFAGSMPSFSAK